MSTLRTFSQEESLGKVYDRKIFKRILLYARPYWKLLILSIVIAGILSGNQVVLPYLTKIGVDKYILINGKYIDPEKITSEKKEIIIKHYKEKSLSLINGCFVLKEGLLDPIDRNEIVNSNAMDPSNYYILDLNRYNKHDRQYLLKLLRGKNITAIKSNDPQKFAISLEVLNQLSKRTRSLVRKPDREKLVALSILYLGILFISFLLMFTQVYLMAWIGQHIMFDIRTDLFHHIQRLPIQFFISQPVGRLVTRVTNDVNVLNEVFTSILVDVFKNLLLLLGIIVAMLLLAPRLAIATFFILPIMIFLTLYFKRKMRFAYRKVREKIALINATLSEHLSGIKIIQAFAKEEFHFNKFKKVNHDCFKANMHQLVVQSMFSPFVVLIENIGVALILYYGGGQLVRNTLTLGTLIAFLGYLSMFFGPIRDIAEKFNIMQSAMASSERIFQILDKKIENEKTNEVIKLKEIKGEIEFKNVWFAYEKENYVLRNISFQVKPGETVAFVGATGSGKTTIINLLSKFYSVNKGKIFIDGHDIETIDRYTLRRHISVVLQDVFLFQGDIFKNIRLNNKYISDNKVIETAKLVFADNFIKNLPNKYFQILEEGGATLSQGQRQLLAFARALVTDPGILILDEATANIDSETEEWIQAATKQIMESRTALIIAHRLSTIKKADKIIVMHKGKIVEIGNHRDLYAQKGLYYRLYQLQFLEQTNLMQSN